MGQGPPGRWLGPHGTQAQLFGCCQNPGVCLMTYFCYPVTLGQLYSRAVEPMSCKKIAAILFVVHVFTQFVSSALTPEEAEENGDDGGSPLLVSVFGFMGIPTQTNTIMAGNRLQPEVVCVHCVRNLILLDAISDSFTWSTLQYRSYLLGSQSDIPLFRHQGPQVVSGTRPDPGGHMQGPSGNRRLPVHVVLFSLQRLHDDGSRPRGSTAGILPSLLQLHRDRLRWGHAEPAPGRTRNPGSIGTPATRPASDGNRRAGPGSAGAAATGGRGSAGNRCERAVIGSEVPPLQRLMAGCETPVLRVVTGGGMHKGAGEVGEPPGGG
mmetsp:Transcript_87109/g.247197  ORF Transcript_87109/g.247197 Transcript_87109/m.247197 type:complete len:323 (+) Transcript_87109:548-1516(+)